MARAFKLGLRLESSLHGNRFQARLQDRDGSGRVYNFCSVFKSAEQRFSIRLTLTSLADFKKQLVKDVGIHVPARDDVNLHDAMTAFNGDLRAASPR